MHNPGGIPDLEQGEQGREGGGEGVWPPGPALPAPPWDAQARPGSGGPRARHPKLQTEQQEGPWGKRGEQMVPFGFPESAPPRCEDPAWVGGVVACAPAFSLQEDAQEWVRRVGPSALLLGRLCTVQAPKTQRGLGPNNSTSRC